MVIFHSEGLYLDSLTEVSLGWKLFTRSSSLHSDSYIFTRMIRFSLGFPEWKHSLILFRLCRLHTTSDLDDLYIKIDQFDETKLFYVESFSIQGHPEGQITHGLHQTLIKMCLVFCVIFWSLPVLYCIVSNFSIRTRIEMIYISKSISSTRRRQSM